MPESMTFTINVHLNTNADPPVTAVPNRQSIPRGMHNVVFQIAPESKGHLAAIYFDSDRNPFETTPAFGNSFSSQDNNDNTTGAPVEYAYTITVWESGRPYSSDPEIENQTGGGGRRRQARNVMVHETT
jgi:hypothetical protein